MGPLLPDELSTFFGGTGEKALTSKGAGFTKAVGIASVGADLLGQLSDKSELPLPIGALDSEMEEEADINGSGNILKGAVSGASAGAAAGPIGAAVGAVGGIALGIVGNKKAEKANDALRLRNKVRKNKTQLAKNTQGAIARAIIPKYKALPFGG
jgi:hypothetical protein